MSAELESLAAAASAADRSDELRQVYETELVGERRPRCAGQAQRSPHNDSDVIRSHFHTVYVNMVPLTEGSDMPRERPLQHHSSSMPQPRTRSPRTHRCPTVFRCGAGPDRAVRRRGSGQRRDRGEAGHAAAGGVQVAQTPRPRASGRPDRSASGRTAPTFSPDVVVAIKALACELPAKTDTPLARRQCPDLARAAVESGIVASISGTRLIRRG